MFGLSLVIPNYNHAKYLPECLQSIFTQTRIPDEVIVVDDASTDNSLEVIRSYQAKYPQLQCIENKTNQGVHATANEGLRRARFDYGCSFAADDLFLPGAIEEVLSLFQQEPDLGLVCGDVSFFEGERPYRFEGYHFLKIKKSVILKKEETLKLVKNTQFQVVSTIYNLKYLKEYGFYRKELSSLCDHYLNYQIALRHSVGYIPRLLLSYRRLPQSYGATISKNKAHKWTLFSNFMNTLSREDKEFQQLFKKSNCLAKCGFFVIYFTFWNPRHWGYLPALCLKKAPFLLVRIWHRLRGTKAPVYHLKPIYFTLEALFPTPMQSR